MNQDHQEMSFLAHIGELRWHLIRIIIAIFLGGIIIAVNSDFVVTNILLGQLNPDFYTYQLLNDFAGLFGMENAFVLDVNDFEVQNREIFGQFNAWIWIAIKGGFMLAFPYILFEIWRFIKPGLTPEESKKSTGIIVATSLLFFTGICFGYFVISPLAIHFGITFKISDVIENKIDHSSITSTISSSTLGSGIMFLLPMVIYFLTRLGVVTPKFLTDYRKHSYVIILIVAGFLTPADALSQLFAAVPLILLYELSVIVSKVIYKKQQITSIQKS